MQFKIAPLHLPKSARGKLGKADAVGILRVFLVSIFLKGSLWVYPTFFPRLFLKGSYKHIKS